MTIQSPAFQNNGSIPQKYACQPQNSYGINPPLDFFGVPIEAKSLALIMDDIDVPAEQRPDKAWNHWLVWNMPPETQSILEGSSPKDLPGVQGKTTGGEMDYRPPCPPQGEHRYLFKLYALDTILDLKPAETGKEELLSAMQGHILAYGELVGKYRKPS